MCIMLCKIIGVTLRNEIIYLIKNKTNSCAALCGVYCPVLINSL